MREVTPITVLDQAAVFERTEAGLMVPMDSGEGLRVVDCADDRGLTEDYYRQRNEYFNEEVHPGRYFGAASGIAIAGLITFAAQHGEQAVTRIIDEYTPEAFVDFAANLSDRAHRLPGGGVEINQHSDDTKEQNPVELADHKHCADPLGCAFATNLGAVLFGSNQRAQMEEARNVLDAVGADLPLDEVAEGITIMQRNIPASFGIHRGALHYSQTKAGRHTPVAIHEGKHAPNDQAQVVVDLAGYRSNANRHNTQGLFRYHHTPGLVAEVWPRIMPEIKLDPSLLKAAGLLLGESTRFALSGSETPHLLQIEVIPPELASAA